MDLERLRTARIRVEGDNKCGVTRMTRARQSPDEEDGWSYISSGPIVEVDSADDQALASAVREALR